MTDQERSELEAKQTLLRSKMRVLLSQLDEAREAHYRAYGRYAEAKKEYENIERSLAEMEKVTRVPQGRSGKRDLQTAKTATDPEAFLKSLTQEQKNALMEELGLLPN